MPRTSRIKSKTGIYHVMLRGADGRIIFADQQDCRKFLKVLKKVKEKSEFQMFAYCLMGNHVHLLLREKTEPLDVIIKRLGVSYVSYYNRKYQLHGHLFQDRFRSEPVETDKYFLDVLRYIVQNPLKAGLCDDPMKYPWVGCSWVFKNNPLLDGLENLICFGEKELAVFVKTPCTSAHIKIARSKRMTDQEAIPVLCEVCGCSTVQEIASWDQAKRDQALLAGLNAGLSIRQLSRLTAVSKYTIEKLIH